MAFEGSVEDRLAIHELGGRYGDAVHRHDTRAFAELWTEDADWHHPALGSLEGREAIAGKFADVVDDLPMIHFMTMLGALAIDGDRATGTSYVSEVVIAADGSHYRSCGRYEDRYRKQGGRWLFSHRSYTLLHQE